MTQNGSIRTARAAGRGVCLFTAALMMSACAQTADLLGESTVLPPKADVANGADASALPQSELQKATAYWGEQYRKSPTKVENGLSYARNLKALGEKQKALTVLQETASLHAQDRDVASEYGRLALEFDQVSAAEKLLAFADDPTKPDWKTISARGTLLAKKGQYKDAIPMFERALQLSNNQPAVLNNLAMAHMMSGEPHKAEELLRKAVADGSVSPKVSQNMALVLGLQGRYDEAKSYAVTASGAEALKSDTDLIRQMTKLAAKAPSAPSSAPMATPAALAATQPRPSDAFRPPVMDTTSAAAGWQTKTANAATAIAKPVATAMPAAQPSASPGLGMKGSQ